MNQSYARVNHPYATLTLASALREVFGVQLYKIIHARYFRVFLNVLNSDWLQHACCVRGMYELHLIKFRYRYIYKYTYNPRGFS